MIKKIHFYYTSGDSVTKIHAVRWVPEGEIRAVLQIAHGMAEHMERYEEFADYMSNNGILVSGNDHLGHGLSVQDEDSLGYFSDKDGSRILIRDMYRLLKLNKEKYPGIPYILMGHSMGSYYARQFLCHYGELLDGAIIMGTGNQPAALVRIGIVLTGLIGKLKGGHYRSRLVDTMAFGGYGKRIKSRRTDRDWLTKEESIVDAFIEDERCGFMFSVNAYYHMFCVLLYLTVRKHLERMPENLPVLFTSGEEDPVGEYGKGVRQVVKAFREAGMRNVELKLYPNDRHEILNETNRSEVYKDLFAWMQKCI